MLPILCLKISIMSILYGIFSSFIGSSNSSLLRVNSTSTEGREIATVVGEAGENILPFDTVILAFIWIPGILSTLIWTIWTGILFLKK